MTEQQNPKRPARYNKFGRKIELAQFYDDRFWRSQPLQFMLTTLTRVASLPNPLFAVHLYNPTSVLFTLRICSLWPVKLNWSWATPIFVHVILGKGSPEALHVKVTFFPASVSTIHGGFTVIFGGTERYRITHSMPWTGFQNNDVTNTHSDVTKYMYDHTTSTTRSGQRSLWYYLGDT